MLQTPVPKGDVKPDISVEAVAIEHSVGESLDGPEPSLLFPVEQERTYACTGPVSEYGEKCTKSFIREHDLYRHLKAEHGLDLTADEMHLLAASAA